MYTINHEYIVVIIHVRNMNAVCIYSFEENQTNVSLESSAVCCNVVLQCEQTSN